MGDDYDEIRNMYKHLWSAIDDSGDFNQPLSIEFENIGTVKFHRLPLEEVVKLEGNEFVVITN